MDFALPNVTFAIDQVGEFASRREGNNSRPSRRGKEMSRFRFISFHFSNLNNAFRAAACLARGPNIMSSGHLHSIPNPIPIPFPGMEKLRLNESNRQDRKVVSCWEK